MRHETELSKSTSLHVEAVRDPIVALGFRLYRPLEALVEGRNGGRCGSDRVDETIRHICCTLGFHRYQRVQHALYRCDSGTIATHTDICCDCGHNNPF